jgi:uncharacterized protein
VNKRLPTRDEALSLLINAGCSSEVVKHTKAVAELALKIADCCNRKGLNVNIEVVEIGALLHDIGRSKTHTVNHVLAGVKIAKSLGLPDSIISIIERHAGSGISREEAQRLGWPAKDYIPQSLEEKIVTYADKLIEGSRKISIKQVLEKFSKDNLPRSSILRMQRLHQELSSLSGDLNADNNVA